MRHQWPDHKLRILTLTYPIIPLRPDACGGAEQVAWNLLHQLPQVVPGIELTTCAARSSRLSGKVLFCPLPQGMRCLQDSDLRRLLHREIVIASEWVRENELDLVHVHGPMELANQALTWRKPVVFTLHMADEMYPANWRNIASHAIHYVCVSQRQWEAYGNIADASALPQLHCIANGIAVERFRFRKQKQAFWLYLGRICPEKAPHLALELAHAMGRRLILAGSVYPFPSHQQYFQNCILPRLDGQCVWIPRPDWGCKRELLSQAAAVIIPSQAAETSSITAMEAAASGTPVMALAKGALPEIVLDGVTGIVANQLDDLLRRADTLGKLNPAACRRHAEIHYQAERMALEYAQLYAHAVRAAISPCAFPSPARA